MARTKHETDELVLALMEWAAADPDAALVVATINDGTHETGALITLGHAGCTVGSAMATVAELLDFAEEQIQAGEPIGDPQWALQQIRAARGALGMRQAEVVQ